MGRLKLSVLVVAHDSEDSRRLVAALVADDHEVRTASDCSSALDVARFRAPEAVILELGLPFDDVATLITELRTVLLPETAVIVGLANAELRAGESITTRMDLQLRHPIEAPLMASLLSYLRTLRMTKRVPLL